MAGFWLLTLVVSIVLDPSWLLSRRVLPSSDVDQLIAAEAEASARVEQERAELNEGKRHLAELEALNASTEQQLVLDEPQPYAQLGASPFRDNFVPLEQRLVRPAQPAARTLTANPPAPQSAPAVQPATAPQPATEPLPPAAKLLK